MIISLSVLMGSAYAGEDIEAQWEKNVQQLGAHDEFVTSQLGETRTGVVYFAKCPLKDFKILSLKLEKFEDKPVFLARPGIMPSTQAVKTDPCYSLTRL